MSISRFDITEPTALEPWEAPTRAFRPASSAPTAAIKLPAPAAGRVAGSGPNKSSVAGPGPVGPSAPATSSRRPIPTSRMSTATQVTLAAILLALLCLDVLLAARVMMTMRAVSPVNEAAVAAAAPAAPSDAQDKGHISQVAPALFQVSLEHGLDEGLLEAGADPALADAIVSIFSRYVNVASVRGSGNSLKLLVDPIGPKALIHVNFGRITAALLNVHGRSYEAFRYVAPDGTYGYFGADGMPTTRPMRRHPTALDWLMVNLGPEPRWRTRTGLNPKERRPIMAVTEGRVVTATRQGRDGAVVEIRHPDGWVSQYSHLAKINVALGSHVAAQQVIGELAEASLAKDVHYAFKWGGGRVRVPVKTLAARSHGLHNMTAFDKFVTHARVAWHPSMSPVYASDP